MSSFAPPDLRKRRHKELIDNWRRNNPERVKATRQAWREKNLDRIRAYDREWRRRLKEANNV